MGEMHTPKIYELLNFIWKYAQKNAQNYHIVLPFNLNAFKKSASCCDLMPVENFRRIIS